MITIYTKDNCPYCDGAKHLLDSWGEEYVEVHINDYGIRDWLVAEGHKTVPQIYFGNKLLIEGGYSGLSKLTLNELQERKNANLENGQEHSIHI